MWGETGPSGAFSKQSRSFFNPPYITCAPAWPTVTRPVQKKKRRLKLDVSGGVFSIAEDTGIRLFLFSYHDPYATSRYVEATYSPKMQAEFFAYQNIYRPYRNMVFAIPIRRF